MDRNAPLERNLTMDPLATPEELEPGSIRHDGAGAPAHRAVVPTEDRAAEDFATPMHSDGRSQHGPLLSPEETGDLRVQWDIIQTGFVDEPRNAVRRADHLVALALERIMSTFNAERTRLETQWDRGDQVSTEDLRIALQRYRSFFQRLLET